MSACAIVREIDAEYKRKCAAAHEAYEKRMKPARKWVDDARAELKKKERALVAHQEQAAEQEQASFVEARLWREEAIRAVRGERPFKISDIPSVERETSNVVTGRTKVSLPRVSCLEDRS